MALSAHQRRRRHLTSCSLPAGFAPEAGAPIARLWILRLLNRGGAKLLGEISDHAALAQHLGVALRPAQALALLKVLQAECALKENSGQRMGFV